MVRAPRREEIAPDLDGEDVGIDQTLSTQYLRLNMLTHRLKRIRSLKDFKKEMKGSDLYFQLQLLREYMGEWKRWKSRGQLAG